MMRTYLRILLTVICPLILTSTVKAAPIVSVDVDPITPGIQDGILPEFTVLSGETFDVDIVVSGIDAGPPMGPLQTFDFTLNFNPSLLSVNTVTSGDYFLPHFVVPITIDGVGSVRYAESTIGGGTACCVDGTLATISFTALGPTDTTVLDLNGIFEPGSNPTGVVLSGPGGAPLSGSSAVNGSITVVPIPGAALLFGTGLIGLIAIARRKELKKQS